MRFMACRNHKWARVPLTSLWLPAMTTCLSVVFCYYKVTTRGSERNAFYHRHVLELSFPLRYGSQRDSGNAQESPKREIPKIVLVSRPGREWLVSSHNPYIAGHCPQGDSQGLIGCCPGKIPTPFHAIPHFKEKCNVGCVVAGWDDMRALVNSKTESWDVWTLASLVVRHNQICHSIKLNCSAPGPWELGCLGRIRMHEVLCSA